MLFKYKALKNNKLIRKTIEAADQNSVINYLKSNNYFPIEIKSAQNSTFSFLSSFLDRVSFTDIVDLTRQLAIMLNAGLTLIDCFDILKKQITKLPLLKLIENLDKELRGGNSFSESLKKYPNHFSNLYISLVKSGEASGKLGEILLKLAEDLEKQREFQAKTKGALIYPVIIVVGMVGVMFVMITFVIPKLLNLYKDFNIDLPITTKILIVVSSFSTKFWPIIIIAVVFFFIALKKYFKTKPGKLMLDTFMLKLPVIGNVVKISALVDATRTLAILISAGVSILDGLSIVIGATNNVIYQNSFRSIYKQVEKGTSLGNAMMKEEIFPPILVQMAIVGEQTGNLDSTFTRISKYFEMESELAIKTMTTLIEPTILVFLGLGVGLLVMSVITPIYNLTSSFK